VCDSQTTRRELLVSSAAAAAALAVAGALVGDTGQRVSAAGPSVPAVEVMPGLSIYPRDAWGADLPPKGPIHPETPKFLLVHHTASASNYASARDVIRSTYSFHTSKAKGWPDVCYEFFVGRDGDVWEGRAGALTAPVIADATGGSQGFAQLVCLLGDFSTAPPTAAALEATAMVLAWLSRRDGIDITPGATTTFVSRGSDKWRAGTVVTTQTIAGHRDMTYTSCPGNGMYLLLSAVRERANQVRATWDGATTPTPPAPPAAPAEPNPDGLRPAQRLGIVGNP